MADVGNKAQLTRTWFAGADADVDIHIEAYEGDIDGSFRYDSLFRSSGLTNFKSVQNQSNTWRGDRIGGVSVKGRKSGDTLDTQRIANEKFVVTVDTTSYIRTAIDYQDDWTAPDFQAEYSREHGVSHAKIFDTAHIIQLIKCSSFVAPESLAKSFFNGLSDIMAGYAAETDPADKADILVRSHKDLLAEFVKRDLGGSLAELVTLMEPDAFNVLLDHNKLMNVDFQGGPPGANSFSMRRVAFLNGTKVIETPRFPTEGTVATDGHVANILGSAFEVSAAEAKAKYIIFHPRKALVTVEAKGMTVNKWDYPKDFQSYLDSYHMYTVGQKRPDAVGVGFSD
jgi:hypothetical protein